MAQDSTHLPSSSCNNGEQGIADVSPATNSGMARVVYLAAETGDIDKLRGMNNWNHQKTPRGNNVLHIHVGKPLEIFKEDIKENVSIRFIQIVLDGTSENSLLSQANNKGDTPLHFAARFGQTIAVREFLNRAEVDIAGLLNRANSSNDTALHDAARGGYVDIVNLLVEEGGGNEDDLQHMPNNLGETPLFLAAERGWTDSFGIIVRHTSRTALAHQGPCGQTPLHAAVLCGNKDIVDQIMQQHDSSYLIRIKNHQGQTPLHCCASRHVKNQHTVLHALLRHDDEYNSAAYIQDNEGRTALLIAVLNLNYRGARMIIHHCPDCIEIVDNKGQNAVHYAANTGRLGGFGFLLAKASKCNRLKNEKDNDGNTALHLLASSTPTPNIIYDWRLTLPKFIRRHNKLDVMTFNNNNFTAGDIVASSDTFRHLGPQYQPRKILPMGRRRNNVDETTKGGERQQTISNPKLKKIGKNKEEIVSNLKRIGETRLVVAALIATVSFTAGFTLPGGFDQSPGENMGMAVLAKKTAFIIFLVSDTIAFTLSSLAVMCYFSLANQKDLSMSDRLSVHGQVLNSISMGALMIAFVTGVFAVVSPFLGVAVIIISFIFFFFYMKLLAANWRLIRRFIVTASNKPASI